MLREQAQRQEVVGLPTPHCLCEFEHTLIRFALEPAEALREERLHPFGNVVLGKELLGLNPIANQIREIENRVAPGSIKDGIARLAGGFECFHVFRAQSIFNLLS